MISRSVPINIIQNKISKLNGKRIRFHPIEYIVIHISGGILNAKGIIKYLSNQDTMTLVDYLVDNNSIYRLNDSDKYFPWSVGIGASTDNPISNKNVVSVMLMSDSKGQVSQESFDYAQRLVHDLMIKYNISIDRVLRSSDVNKRHFTGVFSKDPDTWYEFKKWL